MAQVTVHINGRPHTIGCDDGQEARLTELSEALDAQIRDLVTAVGDIGDSRLLVIAGMSMIDQLSELQAGAPVAPGGAAPASAALQETADKERARADAAEAQLEKAEDRAEAAEHQVAELTAQLAEATRRIDAIAAQLEEA